MRIAITGATGLIGRRVVTALRERGDDVTVLSRDPKRAREQLDKSTQSAGVPDKTSDEPGDTEGTHGETMGALDAHGWDPMHEPAPIQALAGRDAIVHLAGENIAQRWSAAAKQAIRDSRVAGTQNLLGGLSRLAEAERPQVLVSGSAIGYYGAHGDEPIDEDVPAGSDFLAQTCQAWEAEADAAAERHGVRVVKLRTGVVLDREGGALAKMLPPFKLGVGGPVAGGRQYISWVHPQDLVRIVLAALDDPRWQGAINATAPQPQRNSDFSKALGRALHRPSLLPVPAVGLKLMYGEMAEIVTTGARVLPAKALVLGYEFRYPDLEAALHAVLDSD